MDFSITTERGGGLICKRCHFCVAGPEGRYPPREGSGLTSTRRLMAQAADNLQGAVIARDPLDTNGALIAAAGKPVQKLMRLIKLVGEEKCMKKDEAVEQSEDEDLPEEGLVEETLRLDTSAEMAREIELMLWQAIANGLPLRFQDRAHALIEEYNDVVFRLELGMDPPAKVTPLSIELIDENLPERCRGRPRSFAPLQRT